MDSSLATNRYDSRLEQRYQLSNAEQVHSLVRIAVGVGLKYIIESIKADVPDLKINRVVKDEVSETAGISISSLDKYLGEVFQSDRPIDPSTLEKLASRLFYFNKATEGNSFISGRTRYLKQEHIGILGTRDHRQDSEKFVNDLITFIKTKPLLVKFIRDHIHAARYPELINRVFLINTLHIAENSMFENETFGSANPVPLVARASKPSAPIISALCASLLGILLPVFILITGSLDTVLILDYLIHDLGKHFFHIVIFPCMVWAFLRRFSSERLLSQKKLFLVLISAGFLMSFGQTYVQHSQSICDLITSDYVCSDIVEQLFDRAILDTLFLLYSSFLSLLPSLFSIVVFACQLLELRNRGQEICSAAIYSLINLSFLIWAVARSYSEWHEVALSFEASAASDFAIYRYQSFLITATMLVISQILILIQINKDRSILLYLSLFVVVDIVSFWFVTNIHNIAPKFHPFTHLEFNASSSVSVILGPLIYWYFIAIIIIFSYATIVNKAGSSK